MQNANSNQDNTKSHPETYHVTITESNSFGRGRLYPQWKLTRMQKRSKPHELYDHKVK